MSLTPENNLLSLVEHEEELVEDDEDEDFWNEDERSEVDESFQIILRKLARYKRTTSDTSTVSLSHQTNFPVKRKTVKRKESKKMEKKKFKLQQKFKK